jgi:hypothetical protein
MRGDYWVKIIPCGEEKRWGYDPTLPMLNTNAQTTPDKDIRGQGGLKHNDKEPPNHKGFGIQNNPQTALDNSIRGQARGLGFKRTPKPPSTTAFEGRQGVWDSKEPPILNGRIGTATTIKNPQSQKTGLGRKRQ